MPWATGVAKDKQTQANALFAEANQLFAQQAHAPALEKYKAAIALWDHPLIRFNMAVTLIRLDRILDAADDLDSALRFGASAVLARALPAGARLPEAGRGPRRLDRATLRRSRRRTVLLDGKPWFECPGTQKQRVLAGEHVDRRREEGLHDRLARGRRARAAPPATTSCAVPLDAVVKLEYPSPRWMPWTVAGCGRAIALGGLGLWFAAAARWIDSKRDSRCSVPTAAVPRHSSRTRPTDLARQRDAAQLKVTSGRHDGRGRCARPAACLGDRQPPEARTT